MQQGLDPVVDFGLVTVSGTYGVGDTSISLQTGHGSKLPDPAVLGTYVLTWWDATSHNNPSDDLNVERTRVTAKSGDVLTVERGVEGTVASTKNTALKTYKMSLSLSKKQWEDMFSAASANDMQYNPVINGEFSEWFEDRGSIGVSAPASGYEYAYKWYTEYNVDGGTLPTITHYKSAITPGDLHKIQTCLKIDHNGAGSGFGTNSYYTLRHDILNGVRKMCGASKYVTVSFWAKSDVASKKVGIYLAQNYGNGGSPTSTENIAGSTFTLTSTWTRYNHTFSTNTLVGKTFGNGNDDVLQIFFGVQWGSAYGSTYFGAGSAETFVGSGSTFITGVQVNQGAFPFEYSTKDTLAQKDPTYNLARYPDTVSMYASNFRITYSDHIGLHVDTNSTIAAIQLVKNGVIVYRSGTQQRILATAWGAGMDQVSGIIKDGYVYVIVTDVGVSSTMYRCRVDNDISVIGNWNALTISGTSLSTTEATIVGFGKGKFWVSMSGVGIVPYTLSGTTMTSGTTVTISGIASYTRAIKVNEEYIYAWFNAAPCIRLASHDGTLYADKQLHDNTGTSVYNFVYPYAMYVQTGTVSDKTLHRIIV